MLTRKDLLKIFLTVIVSALVMLLLVWLIIEVAPLLIGAIIFLPWLAAALGDGAQV